MRRELKVDLGDRSYPIVIGSGVLSELGTLCRDATNARRALLISNETIWPLYGERAQGSLTAAGLRVTPVVLPDGEQHKTLSSVGRLYDEALAAQLDRADVMVALGGGVVGDTTGFAAATYLRGIAFVQVPTSLEAQVDSSVGGKTGVNHPLGKNLIGAFHQPSLVVSDVDTFASLPQRELRAGLAEVIKKGLIRDAALLEYIETNLEAILAHDAAALSEIVEWACKIKGAIVQEDEREAGVRALLNYGHTLGHALESLEYGRLRHGEAVGVGMVTASILSEQRGGIDAADVERITALLERTGLPTRMDPGVDRAQLLANMWRDKKRVGESLRFVLLDRIGAADVYEVTLEQVERAIDRQAG